MGRRTRPLADRALRPLAAGLLVAALGALAAGLPSATAATAAGPTPAQARMGAIVRAWSARLNASDNTGIAQLFGLPVTIVQGPYEYRLSTRHDVALWYSALPCSGTIVSIAYRGRFATAVFRLGNRGATKCDAPGALAAARFEIVGGKIVSWVQVPVPKRAANPGLVA